MGKKQYKDDLERFHEYGVYLPTRTIYIGSAFTSDDGESGVDAFMVERVVKNLHHLESLNNNPIRVVMNNVGGDVYHGFAIYDAIKRCKSPVTIEVIGHAMSMGSVILQAADHRVMNPNSSQMIHYGSLSISGHSLTTIKWGDQEKKINARMEQIYLDKIREKHPTFTLPKLQKMLNHDTFLTPAESVTLGLADEILDPESHDE